MAKVFISYRRIDSASMSGRIYDRLVARFGRENVFKDVDDIPAGVQFGRYIEESLRQCAVALVVIGREWFGAQSTDGQRRLDDPSDWVRIETEQALSLGLVVIPVLIEETQMPEARELPESLQMLAQINGLRVRNDPDFARDMERLIAAVERAFAARPKRSARISSQSSASNMSHGARVKGTSSSPGIPRRQVLVGIGLTAGFVVAGSLAWLAHPGQGGASTPSATSTSTPSVRLPSNLASLGFVIRTKGNTAYILPPLVDVSAGAFLMGSNPSKDPEAQSDEMPQSHLTLSDFKITKYLITIAEYAAFLQGTSHNAPVDWTSQQQKSDHPVEKVSWDDARTYAEWLAQLTGEQWRLPTEAEWEKAARGTDGRIYPWGNQWDKTRANTKDGGPGTTTPVGAYPSGASPYGAEDIAGNVLEWTSTLYQAYPYSPNDGRENPYATGDRVLRGGSWANYHQNARSAYRFVPDPADALKGYGFRLVRAASSS